MLDSSVCLAWTGAFKHPLGLCQMALGGLASTAQPHQATWLHLRVPGQVVTWQPQLQQLAGATALMAPRAALVFSCINNKGLQGTGHPLQALLCLHPLAGQQGKVTTEGSLVTAVYAPVQASSVCK